MSYSLAEKLFANKPYSEPPVEVFGRKIEFKVPSGTDEDEIIRSASAQSESFVALLQAKKIPTLARSIKSIDGVDLKDFTEIQQRIRSQPETTLAQATEAELKGPNYTEEVITSLYVAYADFRQRHRDSVAALKKTSIPPSPETAG